jgi:hypothetical protein
VTKSLAPILLLAAAGCASGFNRAAMQEKLWDGKPVFTDEDVRRIEQLKPQLSVPFRLAVAPPLHPGWCAPETEGETEEILAWGERLKKEGVVSEFVLIPRMLFGLKPTHPHEGYLKAARAAAARCRADALLVLSSVTDVDRYVNPLAVLNLTLVGMVVVPGHHREALTILEGVVLDNRNEYLYFTASAEGTGSTIAPLANIDERDAIRRSRRQALRSFGDALAREAGRVRLVPPGPRYETPGRR